MKSLIIAEKPSLAKILVQSIHEKFDYKGGYYESDTYCITYAFGHLFQLYDVEDYLGVEKSKWTLEILPYIPEKFQYKLKKDKDSEKTKGIKEQYEVIKSLAKRSDIEKIINCGDSDNEGQVLIDIIINNAFKDCKLEKPVYRLWLPEQTEQEILKQLNQLKLDIEYKQYFNEGQARAFTDWLLGINLTRLISIKANTKLPVGRVLIPIVKAIYDRDIEIKNFKSEKYYQLESNEETNGEKVHLTLKTKYSKEELEVAKEFANILNKEKAVVSNIETKEVKKNPPQLFNLSELQGFISSKHKKTFKEIYTIVQGLYEKGFVTYPRTNSRYLGEDEKDKVKEVIESINSIDNILVFKDKKSIFNSSQIESHSAIIPTIKLPDEATLSADEILVYNTIKNRFIANFLSEETIIDRTIMTITVGKEVFELKGDVIKQEGFLKYERATTKKDVTMLPKLNVGDSINILFKPIEKQTKAPSKYTTKMLSDFLQNPFKKNEELITEDGLSITNMEGTQIGTEATRTGIIENAKLYQYISEDKTVLSIEPKGIALIEILDKLQINLYKEKTVELGINLKNVFKGINSVDDMINISKKELENIFNNSLNIEIPTINTNVEKEVIGICPRCGKNVYESTKNFYCEGFKDEPKCSFSIWKNDKFFDSKGKKITKTMAINFLKNKTVTVKGLKKKDSTDTYNAKINLIDNPPYVNFKIVEFVK